VAGSGGAAPAMTLAGVEEPGLRCALAPLTSLAGAATALEASPGMALMAGFSKPLRAWRR
jgi:hypothetical protein